VLEVGRVQCLRRQWAAAGVPWRRRQPHRAQACPHGLVLLGAVEAGFSWLKFFHLEPKGGGHGLARVGARTGEEV